GPTRRPPAGPTATVGVPPPPPPATNVPPELTAGGQYANVRELGRGGMGVVYLARNTRMDRDEVLKVVDRRLLDKPGAAERFLREIRSAAKLQHTHVVAAYSAPTLGDLLVFAMEYVPGEDLEKLVRTRGPVLVPNACFYAYHAALGLQHAHERGMVHRDIKPSNLILTRAGGKSVVKVLDFGLAKATSEKGPDGGLTRDGQMMGTPHYIAPEQIRDTARADIRADIYALGCTLYFLLTGRPPFDGRSLFDILRAHQEAEPEPLDRARPGLPVGLAAVVGKMMAKDPARRYQTPGEVAKELAGFVRTSGAPGGASGGRKAPDPPNHQGADAPRSPSTQGWQPPSVFRDLDVPQHTHHVNPEDFVPRPAKAAKPKPKRKPAAARRRPPWLIPAAVCGAVLLALAAAGAGGLFKARTPNGTIVIENAPADATVEANGETVTVSRAGDTLTLTALKDGPYALKVKSGGRVLKLDRGEVEVGGAPVRVSVLPPDVPAAGAAKPPPADDPLKPGTVWAGTRTYTKGAPAPATAPYELHVVSRDGSRFAGRAFEGADRKESAVEGEVAGGTVTWREKPADTPDATVTATGKLTGAWLDVQFRGERAGRWTADATATLAPGEPNPPGGGFESLFNGRDLAGWKTHPSQPKGWAVVDGVLVGKGPAVSHLYTDRDDFEDVHLRAEVMVNAGGNSGLYARTPFGPTYPADAPRFLDGYEAQVNAGGKDPNRTGSLYAGTGGAVVKVAEPAAPAGRWFVLELVLEGDRVTVRVDGKETAQYTDVRRRFRRGHVALQMHDPQTEVRFRKVEAKRLGPKADRGVTKPPAVTPPSFTEIAGATPDQLRAWAAALPAGHRPVWVSARAGTDAVLFDAVALPDPDGPAWKLTVNETFAAAEEDHKRMAADEYQLEVLAPFPAGDARIWVKGWAEVAFWFEADLSVPKPDEPRPNAPRTGRRPGERSFVDDKLDEAKKDRGWPLSVGAARRDGRTGYFMTVDGRHRWMGPPDFEFHRTLTAGELDQKVGEYRRRGWRPRLVAAHAGRPDLRYFAVFADNVPAVDWDFSPKLTEDEYRAALAARRAAGQWPQCVASAVVQGDLRYAVVWAADLLPGVKKGALVPAAEARRLGAATNRYHAAEGATFKAGGNELVVDGGPNGTGWLFFGDPDWTDYDFSAKVKFPVPTVPGATLFFRENHEYDGRRRPDGLPSTERVAGVFPFAFGENTTVAVEGWRDWTGFIGDDLPRDETPNLLAAGVWHTARVKVRGDEVETYLNGRLVHRAKPPMPPRGGVGVRTVDGGEVRFTDLTVTAPDGKVLWQGLPELPK
ncbi:MAG: DUF1080 domain-containing protein, partial [Gemmataceae bacterium]|nr:DUF1080 domain-containing protein [Gemmataceae bacterium]